MFVDLERRDPGDLEKSGALGRAIASLPPASSGSFYLRFLPAEMRAFERDAKQLRRKLSGGRRTIVVTDAQIVDLAASYRVAYRLAGGSAGGAGVDAPSWNPGDLIGPDDPRHLGHGKPELGKITEDPGLGRPLPDHGARMPKRTLQRPKDFPLPGTIAVEEEIDLTFREIRERRLDLLLRSRAAFPEDDRESGPMDTLALTMPAAEPERPASWVAGLERAAAELGGLPGQVHCFFRLASSWGSARATVSLLVEQEEDCYSVVWLTAAADKWGRFDLFGGEYDVALLRAMWGFVPSLRAAAAWMPDVGDLSIEIGFSLRESCPLRGAAQDPVFPTEAISPLSDALSGAVDFASDEEDSSSAAHHRQRVLVVAQLLVEPSLLDPEALALGLRLLEIVSAEKCFPSPPMTITLTAWSFTAAASAASNSSSSRRLSALPAFGRACRIVATAPSVE
jgi:hypothetical protein